MKHLFSFKEVYFFSAKETFNYSVFQEHIYWIKGGKAIHTCIYMEILTECVPGKKSSPLVLTLWMSVLQQKHNHAEGYKMHKAELITPTRVYQTLE